MMADPIGSNQALSDILSVLQRIEEKLEGHEARFRSLEEKTCTSSSAHEDNDHSQPGTDTFHLKPQVFGIDAARPSRKGSPTNDDITEDTKTSMKVPYSQWNINQLDRFFNLALSKSLTERLRDCWGMPDDDRLPLKFFRSNILKTNSP